MARPQTSNLQLQKAKQSDPSYTSGVDEHWGPVMDANLDAIDAALVGAFQYISVTLTAAQIKNLDATAAKAVTLIPAPGAGKVILVFNAYANLQFNSIAYASSSGAIVLQYKSGSSLQGSFTLISNTVTDATSSQVFAASPPATFGITALSSIANAAVVANLSGQPFTNGDSKIAVVLWYQIETVA